MSVTQLTSADLDDDRADEALEIYLGREILVVDDQDLNLVAVEAALEPLGRPLVLARSGADALTCLLERDFALIILDVMMPGIDGLETARLIRSRPRSRATPIIFITGLDEPRNEMLQGYQLGAFDFLVKPVRPDVLRAKASVFLQLQERTIALRDAQARNHDRAMTSLYEAERIARRAAEDANARATFLARAGMQLGSSLDYEYTLKQVAQLAVPSIADWCVINLSQDDGTLRPVAVTHVDAEKVALAESMRARFRSPPGSGFGAAHVIATGEPELYTEISDELLTKTTQGPEHLRAVRELGLCSGMVVPIKVHGKPIGTISLVLAGTERRYNHEDLVMATGLGERAGAAIMNAQLYEQATEAIKVRDEFVSVAGHELRTPLATMSLHVEAVLALPPQTPLGGITDRIDKLGKQTERLTRLVEELLDVSRISTARLVLEREMVDLGDIVRDAVSRFAPEAARARAPIAANTATPVVGHWDRLRIEQVVTNLVSNALKYGKGRPIEIDVDCRSDRAVLTVCDHGIGIAAADQARIFERFERAVSSRQFGGLGLGLWIVRQLVEAHGGSISVRSRRGEGSTFTVELPVA